MNRPNYLALQLDRARSCGSLCLVQRSAQPALLITVESVLGTNSYKGWESTGTPLHWNIRNTSCHKRRHFRRQQHRNKTHGKKVARKDVYLQFDFLIDWLNPPSGWLTDRLKSTRKRKLLQKSRRLRLQKHSLPGLYSSTRKILSGKETGRDFIPTQVKLQS